jgi:hypothetical protein
MAMPPAPALLVVLAHVLASWASRAMATLVQVSSLGFHSHGCTAAVAVVPATHSGSRQGARTAGKQHHQHAPC